MSWQNKRARIAALSRSRSANDIELVTLRRDLRAERLADYVAAKVAEAPPLTDTQIDRIAALLRGGEAR